ncbi:hypothetical protein Q8A67_018040 [Cirrhinus molitorella]|uniref:Ig-like domain-containing protein n=1 Tax=Cirrhinus molitorella TaxID=172907 RepID=A0AA88P8D8_9TELE|nr:hypothetical protein Q8A67_018040 [Cirrhinus molitorella]
MRGVARSTGIEIQWIIVSGVLLYDALAWSVSMPKEIHGLQGSCLVIPCSFYYSSYPPENPSRVVWYQWVSRGYPLVYDPWYPNDVIWKFRWKTNLYGDPSIRDCSLLITGLDLSHHGEKLYAWIDPENVGWRTYKFYDVTSTIIVDTQPQQPSIYIHGGERTGDRVTVECSTFHTCPYSKPTITLKGIEGSDEVKDESIKNSMWKTTLTRTGVIKAEHSTVECLVTHHGGITVKATKDKSAECAHHEITIEPELADVTESVAKNFICSVYHSCQKETPTITWNYENMQVTEGNKKLSGLDQITYSNITFLGTKEDNQKKLSCKVKFSGEDFEASVVLHIHRALLYDALAWSVSMPKEIHGLQGSCLVIPCSFYYSSYPPKDPNRVVWYQWVSRGYPLVYDPWYPNDVIWKFRWQTSLYGDPSSWDCSLLITGLDRSHHGEKIYAWIDPENVGWRTYAFYDVTTTIRVDAHPQQPSIRIYGGKRMGDTITVECSTFHTCPYSKPAIALTGIEGTKQIKDESIKVGLWKTTLTGKGVVKAERLNIECSVTHYGGITVTAKMDKRAECVHQKIMIEPEMADVTVGIAKKFTCSVYHSCQKEPTITWNYKNMQVLLMLKQLHSSPASVLMEVKEQSQLQVKTSKCVHHNILIEPEPSDVTEGVAQNLTCTVYHSCQKENPTITWNYENMQVSAWNKKHSDSDQFQIVYSNITFLGAKEDHGKRLICTGGTILLEEILKLMLFCMYKPSFQYVADVIPKITELPQSCVVIPCSFKAEDEYLTRLRVLWVNRKGGYMFHTDRVNVMDNFKGRTRVLGNPETWDMRHCQMPRLFHPTNLKVDKEGKLGNMMGPLLVHLLLQGVLLYDALAWEVKMPKEIHGLRGSCLVIPCSFSYSLYPPKDPRRVVWYQWVSRGYPLVYDPWYPNDVIGKFRWQTKLYGDPSRWDCSLLIEKLDLSHHAEKLYAWIDPENVGKSTYAFYDVTSTISVDANPQQPSISVYGGEKMGDTITVECSTFHTCPYRKPTITLTGIEGTKQIRDESIKIGLWKTTLTGKGVVKAERLNIECTVRHYGGKTVTAKMDKRAECVHQKIMIEPEMADVTVSIAKKFTCSVYHSCQKEPTITWNYKKMQVTTEEKTRSGFNWISYSNIAFLAAKEDNGKKLTCTAKFSGGEIATSVVLHVQRILLYDALGWEVSMPKDIHGLQGSCLVIPCSFSYKSNPPKNPRSIFWYQRDSKLSEGTLVYDPLHPNNVNERFRGKTDLYGKSDWDCSLLIKNLEPSLSGEKLYTRIDPENIAWQNYETDDATSTVIVDATPQQPSISISGGERTGETITVACSAFHTCPHSEPTITLNGIEGSDKTKNESFKDGLWRIILTRTGVIKAEITTIMCSVRHFGGTTVTATEVKTSKCVHNNILIEPELADVTEGVAQNFTCTVYHSCQKENPTITWNYENMQVSAWNKKHSDSDQFQIAYSNITFLGAKEDHGKRLICTAKFSGGNVETYVVLHVQVSTHTGPKTIGLYILAPLLVLFLTCIIAAFIIYKKRHRTNTCTVTANKPFSKPRMPSPKSEPKSYSGYDAEYTNMDELNMEPDNAHQSYLSIALEKTTEKFAVDFHQVDLFTSETPLSRCMMGPLLVHLLLQGILLYDALGWEVRMPKDIHGLRGSCLVIPCSFNYTSNPPKDPHRVVWYQWVSKGYPLVYDRLHPNNVIENFRGKTDLYGDPSSWDCSLLIKNLEKSHHGEKLYAWIDPENVGWRTYKFYDVTTTIQVDASPQMPMINISGGEWTGENITVVCSTFHTCPYSKPKFDLNGIKGSDKTKDEPVKDGLWKTTLTRTGVVKAENSTIECSVTHHGGITVTATKNMSAQCVHHNITIEPQLADVTEGVAKNFICSVYHSCQNENPTITWNYENMQVLEWNKTLSGLNQVTYSNITFLGAKEDHGKKLICTAKFSGRDIMGSVVLNVQYPVFTGLETIGLYILTPSLVFLLACILSGVIIYKKRQRSKDAMSTTTNKPFSKPRMPSPKSDPKSHSGHDYEAEYTNMEELNIPQMPMINISGGEWTGENITVVCSTFHTCPYSKPKFDLNGIKGSDKTKDEPVKDGLWKTTLTRTGVHYKITIKPELADVTEGVAKNFICSVYHSCQNENPTITWNYENMQEACNQDTNNPEPMTNANLRANAGEVFFYGSCPFLNRGLLRKEHESITFTSFTFPRCSAL